jgi:hypothetical protein
MLAQQILGIFIASVALGACAEAKVPRDASAEFQSLQVEAMEMRKDLVARCLTEQGIDPQDQSPAQTQIGGTDPNQSTAAYLLDKSDAELKELIFRWRPVQPLRTPELEAALSGKISMRGNVINGGCESWADEEVKRLVPYLELANRIQTQQSQLVEKIRPEIELIDSEWRACLTGETARAAKRSNAKSPGDLVQPLSIQALFALAEPGATPESVRVALRKLETVDVVAETNRCVEKVNYRQRRDDLVNTAVAPTLETDEVREFLKSRET